MRGQIEIDSHIYIYRCFKSSRWVVVMQCMLHHCAINENNAFTRVPHADRVERSMNVV